MNKANENLGSPQDHDRFNREQKVTAAMQSILEALSIDWRNDPHTRETPARYAKMLCREVCSGRFVKPPVMTAFASDCTDMQVSGPVALRSLCAHHFCPVIGSAWLGYIPNGSMLGLSKFTRLVEWFAARPQVQEELGTQIAEHLEFVCGQPNVAVLIRASHTCMTWRGVRAHPDAIMTTSVMRGIFRQNAAARAEFLHFVGR